MRRNRAWQPGLTSKHPFIPQTTLGDPAAMRSYPGLYVSTRGPSGMAGLDRRASAAPAVAQTMTQQQQRQVMETVMTFIQGRGDDAAGPLFLCDALRVC
jgi:hypothetical protein